MPTPLPSPNCEIRDGVAFLAQVDAIPFVLRSHGHTMDERASSAVRKAVNQ
jgi:hypothetical protein